MLTLLVSLPTPLLAAGDDAGAAPASVGAGGDLRARSDEDLTVMAADWDALDRHQRRLLLTEMKARMARGGNRGSVLRIRTERRYGRIIRQADGRLIRIETQVVHVRPASPEELTAARQGFGVGFEQRVRSRSERFSGGELVAGDQMHEVRLPLSEMMQAVDAALRLQPSPTTPAADTRH
ncbi:MAG: hypothetical protein RIB46_00345 [Pseudomonadales bacterium]